MFRNFDQNAQNARVLTFFFYVGPILDTFEFLIRRKSEHMFPTRVVKCTKPR